MTRRVVWSDGALQDVLDQIEHIARDDPAAAGRIAGRLRGAGARLAEFATGHPGRVPDTFEKSVAGTSYVIAYALADQERTVAILRVIHAARDWPEGGWPA